MTIGPNEDGAELYRVYLESLPCPTCGVKEGELTRLREENERLRRERILLIDGAYEELKSRAERAEAALRRIAGELGEFADAAGETMVEKIRFLRADNEALTKERDELNEEAQRYADKIKEMAERNEAWRKKKAMLENDLCKAWKERDEARASAKQYLERYELEQIIREGVSGANEELRGENRRLIDGLKKVRRELYDSHYAQSVDLVDDILLNRRRAGGG